VRLGTDLTLKDHSKPDFRADIRAESIRTMVVRNLTEVRHLEDFTDDDAVRVMANCLIHFGVVMLALRRDDRVRVTPWRVTQVRSFKNLLLHSVES
jgi:hypothetical protein